MKKVLHVINEMGLGGTETALYRLLCTMQSLDYAFFVIVLSEPGYYSSKIKELGIPIYHLDIKKAHTIKTTYRLITLIRKIKPDVVQTWLYHSDLFGGLIAKCCGVKKILWGIRCEGVGLKRKTRAIKSFCALLSWVIPNLILTNSQIALNKHHRVGYRHKKMRVVYNGFDIQAFYPNKSSPKMIGDIHLPSNALVIGTLARFHKDKDYATLLRAIEPLCLAHPHVYFVLCGQGCCEDNGELRTMRKALTYPERVLLLNGVSDTNTYLNTLDIFVLSSQTEGFPNSLGEAMLCGLPCIATDVGEVKEMLGETGLLVPPQDPEKLTSACLSLINQSEQVRTQLGALARLRIEERYSTENNTKRMMGIYEQ